MRNLFRGVSFFAFMAVGSIILSAQKAPTDKKSIDTGKKVYLKNCATCHGNKGKGEGPASKGLKPAPRDFTSGKFKYGSTDDALFKTITNGSKGTAMPSWKALPEKDRWAVIAFIKATFLKKTK